MKIHKINNTLLQLVAVLEDGQCHDGTTIGKKLKITRSAVWKLIEKLRRYHIKIISIKGKGYLLTEPLILLNVNNIKKILKNKNIDIALFESIDSTNNFLKKCTYQETLKICLAEYQAEGRGRLQRKWHSPFAQNMYFSCLWSFQKDISALSGLSLVIGLVIAHVINSYHLENKALVKWPNDVLCQDKKIAGNLIELEAESNGLSRAIIGIGINVNMISAGTNIIPKPWTSLRLEKNEYIDRNKLVALLIDTLSSYLKNFEQHGISYFLTEWEHNDYLAGKTISLQGAANKIQGIMKGINEQGHLKLLLCDGSTQTFSSGDTSVVKFNS